MESAPGKSEDRHPMHPERACTLKSSAVSAKYNRCISPWIDYCLARMAIIVFRCLCLGLREHNCHTTIRSARCSNFMPSKASSCKIHVFCGLLEVHAVRAVRATSQLRPEQLSAEADQLNFNSWSAGFNMLIGRRSLSYRPPDPFPDEGRRA